MKVIGITGGVGSGKSKVLSYMEKHWNVLAIQADKTAHEQMRSGSRCFREITELFGSRVIGTDGELDRNRLGQIVFQDDVLLKKLNGIVHPAVKKAIRQQIRDNQDQEFAVIEAALLIEDGYQDICDRLVYIYADRKTRAGRLQESRGYSREKTDRIMNSQLPEEEFRKHCHAVWDNSGSFEETKKQIDSWMKKWNND